MEAGTGQRRGGSEDAPPPSPCGAPAVVAHTPRQARAALEAAGPRGVVLLSASTAGLPIGEYHPSVVKKAVVGTGGADKKQIQAMVGHLLPGVKLSGPDAADALAVAITHAHHLASAHARARRSTGIGA